MPTPTPNTRGVLLRRYPHPARDYPYHVRHYPYHARDYSYHVRDYPYHASYYPYHVRYYPYRARDYPYHVRYYPSLPVPGVPLNPSVHRGLQVEEGSKYLNPQKWIRTRCVAGACVARAT